MQCSPYRVTFQIRRCENAVGIAGLDDMLLLSDGRHLQARPALLTYALCSAATLPHLADQGISQLANARWPTSIEIILSIYILIMA